MSSSPHITLTEVQKQAMQLPTEERWVLLKSLLESLQPEPTGSQSDANLTSAATKISEAAFARVWDNSEDAEYDNL
jgi:hypothetical protein